MRAALFDIGGVLIDDRRLKAQAYAAFPGVDRALLWTHLNEAFLPACRGEERFSGAWRRLARALDVPIADALAESLWIDDYAETIDVNPSLRALLDELAHRYVLGVISNTVHEHAEANRRLGIYAPFSQLVLSHEVRLTKDDPRIFALALSRVGIPAHEVAFVDDVERYVRVAESLGMRALHFDGDVPKLRGRLAALGFELAV